MPLPITNRQKEYLEFIRTFIQENKSAPRMDEIAKHFGVTSPTAHKTLETLQEKGYLHFRRDNVTGFYIRLVEFEEPAIEIAEISVLGDVDQFGIVQKFPKKIGHSLTPTLQSNPKDLFALHIAGNLPEFNLVPHDIIIFDQGKKPKVGDICLTLVNDHRILVYITDVDQETDRLSWTTLSENDSDNPAYVDFRESQSHYPESLPKEFILATALRLTRYLAY